MPARPKNYSKSANRALDVLDYLATVRRAARAAEIADAIGIARSSADQLLKSMVLGGYLVVSTEGKTYFPSLRLAQFGQWIAGCYPGIDRLRDIVEQVHAETGEIVTLTMQNDCFMQMMAFARSGEAGPPIELGARYPVVGSAIGGAALTTQPRKQVLRLIERARRRHVQMDEGERPFAEDIRYFRMKGYSWRQSAGATEAPGHRAVDYWSIAMPLPGAAGIPEMVLGLAGPRMRVRSREREIVNVMRRSIRRNLPG